MRGEKKEDRRRSRDCLGEKVAVVVILADISPSSSTSSTTVVRGTLDEGGSRDGLLSGISRELNESEFVQIVILPLLLLFT